MRTWRSGPSRLAAGALVLAVVAGGCSSGSDDGPEPVAGAIPAEAGAGTWKTWVLSSPE